jgi:titin
LAPSNSNGVASSESTIEISWQDNSSNETGFEVHRSATVTGSFTLRTTRGPQITRYSDQGLEPGSQYCYKVRAARVKGSNTSYSAFSNTACATTPGPPPPPAPPAAASGAIARPLSSSSVALSWTDNATNEDGFRIESSIDGMVWGLLATAGANTSTAGNLPAVAEQQMCYRVVAFNAGGKAAPSNTACATAPARPTNVVVTRLDAGTVALTWSDNSAVEDGYQVRLFQTNCIGPACPAFDPLCENYGICERTILIAELPANSTAYTGPNPGGVGYSYNVVYVVAMKDGGHSDPSDPRVPLE